MPIKEIDELKDSLIESLLPVKIYLFGSFAEGRDTTESDFDFYIVVKDSNEDMLTLTAKAYKSIRFKQRRAVDIIVNTEHEFATRRCRKSCVEYEVSQKGVLLYGE